jgi:hypothetical protein
MPIPTLPLVGLGAFRTELHACVTRRADALFELGERPAIAARVMATVGAGEIVVSRTVRDLVAGSDPRGRSPRSSSLLKHLLIHLERAERTS